MEASDMLDVLHFYFEQDNMFTSEEHMLSQSRSRESLYENLYGIPYKYKVKDPKYNSNNRQIIDEDFRSDDEDETESLRPFDPLAGPPKAYVPPTDFNPDSSKPFGKLLDEPLG